MTHIRIRRDPSIMMGKPCVANTRIPVETILKYLGSGDSIEDVLAGYPVLTKEDILSAISYAADYLHAEGVIAA